MKRWQKFAILSLVPTITALHSRWIAYLLRTEFDGVAVGITIAVMVVMVLVVANSLGLFESEP